MIGNRKKEVVPPQYHYFHRQQLSQETFNRQLEQGKPVGIPCGNSSDDTTTNQHEQNFPFPRSRSVSDVRNNNKNSGNNNNQQLPRLNTNTLPQNVNTSHQPNNSNKSAPHSASATSSFFSPTSSSRLAPHTNEPSTISTTYSSAPIPLNDTDEDGDSNMSRESFSYRSKQSLLSSRLANDTSTAVANTNHTALSSDQNNNNNNNTSSSSSSSSPPPDMPPEPELQPKPVPQPTPPSSTDISHIPTSTDTTTKSTNSTNQQHLDIANHPVPDVIVMLTALLQKIIDANDALQNNNNNNEAENNSTGEQPTDSFSCNVLAFHGRNVPAISLHAYLSRILKYCPTTNEVFISLLVYFDRIAQRANSKSNTSQMFVMDSYNIHRLIIAGITVASKFFSDVFYKNSRYAKVGGLPVEELNHLELQFLLLTNFRLMISLEELQRYADLLLRFWEKEQASSSTTKPDVPA